MPPPEDADPVADAGLSGRVLLGRFRVEKLLGRGGMGEVLLAHDLLLRRRVALKYLRADGAHAADRRAAILQEARRAGRVSDRRIAAIHDVLELEDDLLIVMEYVEGSTLREALREPLPLVLFWDVADQLLGALGAAHEQGVIHRDLKPENLMLTREREVRILDFGLAWNLARPDGPVGSQGTTATREIFRGLAGTPSYMAPEAHYGGQIDARTDIFSLGAVFYEMLTAQPPFAGESYEQLLDRIMNSTPRPAPELNPAVPPELARVVERMLARDPAQRFDSCADVRTALVVAKGGAIAPLGPGSAAVPARERFRAFPAPLAAMLALAAVALALAGPVLWRSLVGPSLPSERRLVLLPPATPGASGDFTAFALGATEVLGARLLRHQDEPGFQMASFADVYGEKLANPADARRVFGANLALVPTLAEHDNRLQATLELRESARGRKLGERTLDLPLDQPLAFADSLYRASLALLRLPERPPARTLTLGVRGAGTLRFLFQGIGRKRSAETPDAGQRSLDDLEAACRTEPDAATARAWLAVAETRQNTLTRDSTWIVRAEASAREAVGLDSSRAEAHRILGAVLGYEKRYPESLAALAKACALDPADDDAWYRWGRAWQRLGDAGQEKRVYLDAIALRPHCWRPYWWLASWEYRNGHVAESRHAYEQMIRRAPDYADGYAYLGGLLVLQGEYRNAIDTLRLAARLRPGSAVYENLGTAYFNSGRLADAVDAYNQAFQFGETSYRMWLNLGDAYYWLRNRPDQARDAYQEGLRLGREEIAAHARRGSAPDPLIPGILATALPKLGEPDSARAMLAQALALDGQNSRIQYDAALTLWQLGERDSALAWLHRAVQGGYPVAWIRDSPVHREWSTSPAFRSLLAGAPGSERSPGKGAAP